MSAPKHASLKHAPCNLIGGRAIPLPREAIRSHNPARPDERIWTGSPILAHADDAVAAARAALAEWRHWPLDRRIGILRAYQRLVAAKQEAIASLICDEAGKVLWEARQEAALLGAKVEITLNETPIEGPMSRIKGFELALGPGRAGRCFFRQHGVMSVIGPFNFPMHLPNGHIVPALAAGNTVVLKPSEKTPACGQMLGELFLEALAEAGAPSGVVNVVQGGADVATRLVSHEHVDGILFTGSWPVGRRILEMNLDTPGRICALEMGGNNAAVVLDDADLKKAVLECARASFATAGQRCTCTRRIIVQESIAERFIPAFCKTASALVIGDTRADHPVFMGPLIRAEARDAALRFFSAAARSASRILIEPRLIDDLPNAGASGHYMSPGALLVDRFTLSDSPESDAGCDVEAFGPIVRISTVRTLDDAIEQANTTRYGLAASLFSKRPENAERFLRDARAGCVNWNTGTAGASGKLPFGGLGHSGNHRPAGAFSLDYCAYPVASMLEEGAEAAVSPGMQFREEWL